MNLPKDISNIICREVVGDGCSDYHVNGDILTWRRVCREWRDNMDNLSLIWLPVICLYTKFDRRGPILSWLQKVYRAHNFDGLIKTLIYQDRADVYSYLCDHFTRARAVVWSTLYLPDCSINYSSIIQTSIKNGRKFTGVDILGCISLPDTLFSNIITTIFVYGGPITVDKETSIVLLNRASQKDIPCCICDLIRPGADIILTVLGSSSYPSMKMNAIIYITRYYRKRFGPIPKEIVNVFLGNSPELFQTMLDEC